MLRNDIALADLEQPISSNYSQEQLTYMVHLMFPRIVWRNL